MKNYMALDQYGNTYHNLGQYPRKTLLDKLGAKKACKQFIDGSDGKTYHTGYVIKGHWLSLFEVTPMRTAA